MVSIEKISDKIVQLSEYLMTLKKISATSRDDFTEDKILIGSAKYYLQVSIECCLDVANHIISADKLRPPSNYADSFNVLMQNDIISLKLGKKLQQMAKFRNRLVHLYGEIDDAYVYDFIKEDLRDIEKYKAIMVARYLSS
jgi:uncharacterized protein YutE (UPF0331/DUF86 family)